MSETKGKYDMYFDILRQFPCIPFIKRSKIPYDHVKFCTMSLLKEQKVCVCFYVFNIVYTAVYSTVFLQPRTREIEPTHIFSHI